VTDLALAGWLHNDGMNPAGVFFKGRLLPAGQPGLHFPQQRNLSIYKRNQRPLLPDHLFGDPMRCMYSFNRWFADQQGRKKRAVKAVPRACGIDRIDCGKSDAFPCSSLFDDRHGLPAVFHDHKIRAKHRIAPCSRFGRGVAEQKGFVVEAWQDDRSCVSRRRDRLSGGLCIAPQSGAVVRVERTDSPARTGREHHLGQPLSTFGRQDGQRYP
jgi:hypothetical protein